MRFALGEVGFKVVALRSQVSQKEFEGAPIAANGEATVSSLTGHAESLVPPLREKCTEAGLKDVFLYLAGYLSLGELAWEGVAKKFKEMSIYGVCPPGYRQDWRSLT
jgi:methylmalonyl-CoA mutase cobalamin-binding subunit